VVANYLLGSEMTPAQSDLAWMYMGGNGLMDGMGGMGGGGMGGMMGLLGGGSMNMNMMMMNGMF
jgi:hypothetical protein